MLSWARVTRTMGYSQSFHHLEGWDLPLLWTSLFCLWIFSTASFFFPFPQESHQSHLLHLGTTQVSWQKSDWDSEDYSSGSPLKNLLNAGHRGAHF